MEETLCGIAAANAANPDAPEYQKGYKPQFNTGCCGGCSSTTTTSSESTQTIISQRNVREDFI